MSYSMLFWLDQSLLYHLLQKLYHPHTTIMLKKDTSKELMNKEWSFTDWVYLAEIKNDGNLANHFLLGSLRSYKVFF